MSIVSKKLRESAGARFGQKYVVDPSGCWLWIAGVNARRGGYGKFHMHGAPIAAHRASWLIHCGAIPAGSHVLHSCDTPACVNPAHLSLGTNADNVADMDAKGRRVNTPHRGEENGRAKLTASAALEIFSSGGNQDEVAARYGVSRSLVSLIRLGKSWAHVTGGIPR